MKQAALVIGVVLIILGVIALVWGFIPMGTEEHRMELGPIELTAEEDKRLELPPVLGIVSLVGGIALVAVSALAGREK